MLNNHKAHHYPPKIELDVEKVSSSSRQSTYIEIDVVGISGEKNFILKPKPRPAMPQGMPFVPEHGNSGLVYGTMPPWGQMVPPAYHSPRYDPQYMSQGGYICVCPVYRRSHGCFIPQVMFHSLWNPRHHLHHSVHHHIVQCHTIPPEPVELVQ